MAKTKREFILATCFLSGAAAIISLVSLGTQEWITSSAKVRNGTVGGDGDDSVQLGLFGGLFHQTTAQPATFELTTVCLFDLNVCALLCGKNMEDNLRKLYNKATSVNDADTKDCPLITVQNFDFYERHFSLRSDTSGDLNDRGYINAGVWLCTIIFLIVSAIMGLISAALAVFNTATNPYQNFLSIFGLYIYNAIACFFVLLVIILWGAMFSASLQSNDLPTYKTFFEFYTKGYSHLGYSYWINLAPLFLYIASIFVLYIRDWLISKEPEVNVHIEENADPVIYLY